MINRESITSSQSMATRITVSLPDKEHAALAELARRYDVSLSWLTRKAVTEFLSQYGKGGAQLMLDLPHHSEAEKK